MHAIKLIMTGNLRNRRKHLNGKKNSRCRDETMRTKYREEKRDERRGRGRNNNRQSIKMLNLVRYRSESDREKLVESGLAREIMEQRVIGRRLWRLSSDRIESARADELR